MVLPLIACPALHPVSVVSPLNVSQFTLDLAGHPDRQAVAYVLKGLQHGFHLGFQPARRLKPAKKNKPSAFQNPKVIDDYLANEVARGRVAGPFPSPPLPNLQVSSFGVIPKKGQPGKWRLIVDMSSPHGSSVNDGIDPGEFSMHYIHLDQIINMIAKHGPGAPQGHLNRPFSEILQRGDQGKLLQKVGQLQGLEKHPSANGKMT